MGLLNEYLSLSKEYNRLSDELSASSDYLHEFQCKILNEFGLPGTPHYLHYLWVLPSYTNPEQEFDNIIVKLHKLGTEYLRSDPRTNIEILRNARLDGSKSGEILPLIGVIESPYTEFIYEEIFLSGRESEERTLDILKRGQENTSLTEIYYRMQNLLKLKSEINPGEIDYFNEYLAYNPDLETIFNPMHILKQEDILAQTDYREHLLETVALMQDFGQRLFTSIINIALSGELKDEELNEGLIFSLKEDDLRDLDDQNINSIIRVLDVIGIVQTKLINLNSLGSDTSASNECPF